MIQYKTITVSEIIESELDELGKDDWELVAVVERGSYQFQLIFKRYVSISTI